MKPQSSFEELPIAKKRESKQPTPESIFLFLEKKLRDIANYEWTQSPSKTDGLPVWAVKDGKVYDAYIASVHHEVYFERCETKDGSGTECVFDSYIMSIGFVENDNPFTDGFGDFLGFRSDKSWYKAEIKPGIIGKTIFLKRETAIRRAPKEYREHLENEIKCGKSSLRSYVKLITRRKKEIAKCEKALKKLDQKEVKQ